MEKTTKALLVSLYFLWHFSQVLKEEEMSQRKMIRSTGLRISTSALLGHSYSLLGLDSVFLQAFLAQIILEALLVLVLQVLVLEEMVEMGTFLMLVLELEATLPDQSNGTS